MGGGGGGGGGGDGVGGMRFLAVPGCSWWFLLVLGDSWWFMVVHGSSWWLLLVLCGSWWFLIILADYFGLLLVLLGFLAVLGLTWWFLWFLVFFGVFAMAKIRRIGHDHQPPFFLGLLGLLLLGRIKRDTKPVSVGPSVGRSNQGFYSIPYLTCDT